MLISICPTIQSIDERELAAAGYNIPLRAVAETVSVQRVSNVATIDIAKERNLSGPRGPQQFRGGIQTTPPIAYPHPQPQNLGMMRMHQPTPPPPLVQFPPRKNWPLPDESAPGTDPEGRIQRRLGGLRSHPIIPTPNTPPAAEAPRTQQTEAPKTTAAESPKGSPVLAPSQGPSSQTLNIESTAEPPKADGAAQDPQTDPASQAAQVADRWKAEEKFWGDMVSLRDTPLA
jgi:hypothetical protein